MAGFRFVAVVHFAFVVALPVLDVGFALAFGLDVAGALRFAFDDEAAAFDADPTLPCRLRLAMAHLRALGGADGGEHRGDTGRGIDAEVTAQVLTRLEEVIGQVGLV